VLAASGLGAASGAEFENLMSGRVVRHDEAGGVTMVDVAGGLTVAVPLAPDRAPGSPLTLAIRAEDLLVALEVPRGLSARNVYEARIAWLGRSGVDVTLRCVPTRAPGAAEWIVRVTPSAVASLELTADRDVFLAVKSHSVRLL
jgi:molybdate transport system ATP-binding protein